MKRKIYCTSFCNSGHDLKTGRPIEHECYIIPPKLLRAERDDSPNKDELWSAWSQGARRLILPRGC